MRVYARLLDFTHLCATDIHAMHFSALALRGVVPRNYRVIQVIQDRPHINLHMGVAKAPLIEMR